MALTSGPETLPNLKIQLDNVLLDEAMDVDDDKNEGKKDQNSGNVDSELEEGEISDTKDDDDPRTSHAFKSSMKDLPELPDFERRYENKSGAFVTGIDIFSKDGQEKLNVRAKRFGLDPSEAKPLTSVQLHELYESLGIAETEENALEKQGYRLDALHIRGTDEMSTQDVFDYFKEFGPASIEWINDVSCNVVWLDKASPARALLGVSRPISGLTQTGKREMEEVVLVHEEEGESEEEDMADTSINSQQPAVDETLITSSKEDKTASKAKDNRAVPASEINVPIPPGYWRLGTPCPKAKFILLRYSTRNDRKPKQAEKMSEYYKKYGNPNYGGIRGIISTSRKRRYHSDRRHSDDIDADLEGSKNPWGTLAQHWGTMDGSHTTPGFIDPDDPLALERPTELRNILRTGRSNPPPPPPTIHSSESDSEISSESSEEDSKWRKRLKGPIMRMYADDEEKKIEKRKKLKAKYGSRRSPVRTQSTDLRSKLALSTRPKLTRGSVWTRLEAARSTREVQLAEPSADEWSSEPEDDIDDVVVTTVRSQVNDLRHTLGNRKTRDDSDDLRSKLNKKKSKKDTSSPQATASYNKSPLRIEINNDEYCGESGSESGSGSSSGSSSGSGSSSSSSSSSGSSSGSGSSSSGSESSDEEEAAPERTPSS